MIIRNLLMSGLTLLHLSAHSQDTARNTYVGVVNGMTKAEFAKKKSSLTETMNLPKIQNSKYNIEIRLYETYFLPGLTYCTTIYLDTTFKINRTKHWRFVDTTKYQSKETNPIDKIRPDTLFSRLIENGVFSLPNKDYRNILKESKPKMYTKNGLTDAYFVVVADGVAYFLEYKIDNVYNRVYFSNPDIYSKCYPDIQVFRRQFKIATLLGAGFE